MNPEIEKLIWVLFLTPFATLFMLFVPWSFIKNKQYHLWCCQRLGWHKADTITEFDGASLHGVCKWCGKEVMQDSQGNWF